MFKKFLVSAISLLTAAALVSCGPGEVPAAGNTGNQEEECTITFSWWGSDERHEAVSMELLTPEEAAQGIYANIVYTLGEIKEGLK